MIFKNFKNYFPHLIFQLNNKKKLILSRFQLIHLLTIKIHKTNE